MAKSIRIRKRPCRYGNPSLGTFYGQIHTFEECGTSSMKVNKDDCANDDESVCSSSSDEDIFICDDISIQEVEESLVCCMVHVPSEQLPEGVLHLARFHRPFIRHVRIVVSTNNPKKRYNDHAIDTDCCMRLSYIAIFTMKTSEAAADFVTDLHKKPYSSLEPDMTCRAYRCLLQHNVAAINKPSPTSLQDNAPQEDPELVHSLQLQRSLHNNPVLRSFDPRTSKIQSSIPSMASITDDNMAKKREINSTEVNNCAVCLEKLIETEESSGQIILTTVCNHSFHADCLLRWEDTCPVCRYDHSGSNQTLSSCNECGSLDRIFICLICGVTSCWKQNSEIDEDVDQLNHAIEHYQHSLHAYALEAETQHVWDFVGGGYVHRLLHNEEDGKIVETSDPQNTRSDERTLSPGLSTAEEAEMVHRKLEGFAGQYQTILKNQLEQQRQYYEDVIDSIQQDRSSKEKCLTGTHAQLIGALKQERHQVEQRLMLLRRNLDEAIDEERFQKDLVDNLELNHKQLQEQINDVRRTGIEARINRLKRIPELEAKVGLLMRQLDQGG